MRVSGNIETILNYFIDNIKEVQKNNYRTIDTIALLLDLHHNSIKVLAQLGDDDARLHRLIKKLLIHDLVDRARDELLAKEGASHE